VVTVAGRLGPEAQAGIVVLEDTPLRPATFMRAYYQLSLWNSEEHIGRAVHKGAFHCRPGFTLPLHGHRSVTVILDVGFKRRMSGMTHGNTVKDFPIRFRNAVGIFFFSGAQAVGDAQDARAALTDAGR